MCNLFQIALFHTSGTSASFGTSIGKQLIVSSIPKIAAPRHKQLVLLLGSGAYNFCQHEIYWEGKRLREGHCKRLLYWLFLQ